ncbi:hypothetical protein IFR05_003399 [Cadophora sp. M221]|nr:hypothetical protein IFR05_003399 [Cadophora sp. M221]
MSSTDLTVAVLRTKHKPKGDAVSSLRKLSLNNLNPEVRVKSPETGMEKMLADQPKGGGVEEEFSEIEHKVAAELAKHAGRK